jgi:hypothetical protein
MKSEKLDGFGPRKVELSKLQVRVVRYVYLDRQTKLDERTYGQTGGTVVDGDGRRRPVVVRGGPRPPAIECMHARSALRCTCLAGSGGGPD